MGKRIHHLREVSEIEAKALRKLSKSRTQPYRRVHRAKLLVHMIDDETLTASKAAKQAGFKSGVSGAHWVNRFNEAGLEGLTDKPRSGKPDTHSQQVRSRVIDLALRKPRELGYPFELWTLKRLQSAFKEREGIHLSDSRYGNGCETRGCVGNVNRVGLRMPRNTTKRSLKKGGHYRGLRQSSAADACDLYR